MRQMPGSRQHQSTILRISGPEVFRKKDALTNIAKFTGKNLCMFSCEFCEISKSTFSYRTPPGTPESWKKINGKK